MLVEINLLPKKEPKKSAMLVWVLAAAGLAALLAGLFFWQYTNDKKKLDSVEESLVLNNKIAESSQASLKNYEESDSAKDLKTAITWAEEQKVDNVFILKQLTAILPDRGFIQELEVSEKQKVTLNVQFDTKSAAAYYLNSLLQYSWIDEAVLVDSKSTDILEGKVSDQIDEAIESLKEGDIEPRYYATYEIVFSAAGIKAAENTDEGEDSP
ncbi:fimbrial assembly protein [Niallia taxi]|uniref:fimbrial assembly protein n=1 Tax=Niallia taxi TaxID=2499688 RepID=UPI0011A9D481|nr:fimbrial assembly protein [Niallia taxi]MCT2343138.1 fimbrial assembly protein [Niallia taxi]MED3962196.1 fimbrial assembly protein [Niallia taxi]WOD64175.1 fimbrial assembly protein [Niallia taxi]